MEYWPHLGTGPEPKDNQTSVVGLLEDFWKNIVQKPSKWE